VDITADRVVTIHYTLKDDSGAVLDSSAGGEPLAYIQGHGNLVSGLEKALEGKAGRQYQWPCRSPRPRATGRATRR
jgi:FKBP-type peptidyl-prolyl cis-trans isomerase SlyD